MKLRKLLKKIHRTLFPKTEIEYVEAALSRYRRRAQAIKDQFAERDAPCCVFCFGGSEYSKLIDKIERVEFQLERLRKRKSNDKMCASK